MPLDNIAGIDEDAYHLADHLQNVLDKVVQTYQSYSMPIPDRQYWTVGQPVVDCEQIVVTFMQMYIGSPGDEAVEPRRCSDPRSATINILVSRCIPVVGPGGRAPSAERIQNGSLMAAYDAWILLESVRLLDTWDQTSYGLGVIATVETPPAEGGFQSVMLTMTSAVP